MPFKEGFDAIAMIKASSQKLSEAVAEAVRALEVVSALRAQGIEAAASKPAEFASFVRKQLELHRQLVKDVDLKISE